MINFIQPIRCGGSGDNYQPSNFIQKNELNKLDKHMDETVEPIEGKILHVSDKGFGFITSEDIKFTRIFFHWTGLNQDTLKFTDLKKNMLVRFIPMEVEGKGWRAIKIEVLDATDRSESSDVA